MDPLERNSIRFLTEQSSIKLILRLRCFLGDGRLDWEPFVEDLVGIVFGFDLPQPGVIRPKDTFSARRRLRLIVNVSGGRATRNLADVGTPSSNLISSGGVTVFVLVENPRKAFAILKEGSCKLGEKNKETWTLTVPRLEKAVASVGTLHTAFLPVYSKMKPQLQKSG